jgi:hypothetical protein
VALAILFLIYQAPNIALLAYKSGVPIANTDRLGVKVTVRNGWYPVASTDSLLGKIFFTQGGHYVVLYHRFSSFRPWKQEMFAIMAYPKSVNPNLVEATREVPWGRVMLIKAIPSADPGPPLYAVPNLGVGILTEDVSVLSDIVTISSARDG